VFLIAKFSVLFNLYISVHRCSSSDVLKVVVCSSSEIVMYRLDEEVGGHMECTDRKL